jgi:hypothetical protein
MTEVSEDATILLATSWQALSRAKNEGEQTMICNCTIVLVFAAFYIEANLNHIIGAMNKTTEMSRFLGKKPGLQDKLAWFYNCYVARVKTPNKQQMYNNGIFKKLRRKFPGFNQIYQFRNKISHGKIDRSIANLDDAQRLRNNAKSIVDELFNIAAKTDHVIPKSVTYADVVAPNNGLTAPMITYGRTSTSSS